MFDQTAYPYIGYRGGAVKAVAAADRDAAEEALLLTYDQFDSIYLRRKVAS